MADKVHEIRKPADNRKNHDHLGLVDRGPSILWSGRVLLEPSPFHIRTAIRNQLERHADVVKAAVTVRNSLDSSAELQPRRSRSSLPSRQSCTSMCGPCQ